MDPKAGVTLCTMVCKKFTLSHNMLDNAKCANTQGPAKSIMRDSYVKYTYVAVILMGEWGRGGVFFFCFLDLKITCRRLFSFLFFLHLLRGGLYNTIPPIYVIVQVHIFCTYSSICKSIVLFEKRP